MVASVTYRESADSVEATFLSRKPKMTTKQQRKRYKNVSSQTVSESCILLNFSPGDAREMSPGVDIRFQKWPDIMSDHIRSWSDMV